MKKILILCILCIPVVLNAQQNNSFKAKDGTPLFYTSYNSGQKVIFLYGGPGYGCQSIYYWNLFIKNYQSIFYDQRGCGLSKNVKTDSSTINLRTAVSDLEDLRKHLKEEQLTLIGYSWGAALAMAYASKYPDKVKNLILIAPIGPDLSFRTEMYYNILSRRSKLESDSLEYWSHNEIIAKDAILASKNQTYYNYIPYFFNHETGSKLLWKLINQADFNPAMFNLMWDDLGKINYDLKMDLKKYKGKCAILRGQQDVIGYHVVVQIKECLPQITINELQGCGHFVDLENLNLFRFYLNVFLND